MQATHPERRAATWSEQRPADSAAREAPGAGTGAPTLLDLAANPAAEGIAQRTLLDVCMDLFAKLEASLVTNRQEFIDAYFATLVKQDEMTTLWTEPAYYEHLRTVIQKHVLPLYEHYCAIRAQVLERTEQRSWPKYCMWAIGIGLALELVFTEGRLLRPPTLLPLRARLSRLWASRPRRQCQQQPLRRRPPAAPPLPPLMQPLWLLLASAAVAAVAAAAARAPGRHPPLPRLLHAPRQRRL